MKKWKILDTPGKEILDIDSILKVLYKNRGIALEELDLYLNPDIHRYDEESVGISRQELLKLEKRVLKAIDGEETIVIFGDYDVDGICATAILWETLFKKTRKVIPYIPDRIEEGYGLSKKGLENVLKLHPTTSLILTVDNGIVAHDAVLDANKRGVDVVVTDHHVQGEKLPEAYCVIHTTNLCGAGIAWFIARHLKFESEKSLDEKIQLACLATVADVVPLIGANRAIVKRGLEILKETKRPGLIELLKEAAIEKSSVGVYTIGHVIAPRLNASGRIQSAMNALRLLCTRDSQRARDLALMLSGINKDRQGLTEDSVEHAKLLAIHNASSKITVVADESYNQGVIGLIASRLVENYYKPALAISKGEVISKGSARSIKGVNIIELLRSVSEILLEAGGHPMAAGFSLETKRIDEFMEAISKKADQEIADELLQRMVIIDCLIPFTALSKKLIENIDRLGPFGMANPEPVFATDKVRILEIRKIGREQDHLKMKLEKDGKSFDAIGFRMADKYDIMIGDIVSVAYTVEENEWNGRRSIQLKIKDIGLN